MSQHEMWTQGAGVFFGANKGKTAPVFHERNPEKNSQIAISWKLYIAGGFKYCLFFIPKIGEDSQFDKHIFHMGWFNHQLDDDAQLGELFKCFNGNPRNSPQPKFQQKHIYIDISSNPKEIATF